MARLAHTDAVTPALVVGGLHVGGAPLPAAVEGQAGQATAGEAGLLIGVELRELIETFCNQNQIK